MKLKIILSLTLALAGSVVSAQTEKASTGLAMQEARSENLKVKGPKTYYPADKFDLSGLPAYQPKNKATGTIRLWGSNYIVDGKVSALFARYRIALSWPALGMGQFMGIVRAPDAIHAASPSAGRARTGSEP